MITFAFKSNICIKKKKSTGWIKARTENPMTFMLLGLARTVQSWRLIHQSMLRDQKKTTKLATGPSPGQSLVDDVVEGAQQDNWNEAHHQKVSNLAGEREREVVKSPEKVFKVCNVQICSRLFASEKKVRVQKKFWMSLLGGEFLWV